MELGSNFGSSKPLKDSSSSCGELFLTIYPKMYKRENVLIVMIGVLFAWRVGNNPSYSKRLQQFSEDLEATAFSSGRLTSSPLVVKLNTDGVSSSIKDRDGGGGLLRTNEGQWIYGYTRNIGRCSALIAEAWAILDRLELAWKLGFKRIELESDSLTLVNSLSFHESQDSLEKQVIKRIKRWLREDWEIHIHHVYLEGNKCADFLANLSFSFDPELYVLESAPFGIDRLLRNDASGMFSSRSLCLDVAFML
ncbi:hypothetical protein Patl1_13454 [Pistacia atlantica]|uniref:Uncharacterized protein n=1 Tax=Pistacia atlantica TaxID=434234 RepID=A0ACC1AS08_9ROSI|nr:hypothetical protein Patl1_13454 [Pistacia atlantica]